MARVGGAGRRAAPPTTVDAGVAGRDGGQSTVEFALVLPLLLMGVLLVVQAGLVVRDQVLVVHAAREAARAAAVDGDVAAGEAAARRSGLHGEDLSVSVTDEGKQVRATVRYRSRVVVPLLRRAIDDVTVEASVSMRDESSSSEEPAS